MSHGVNCEAGAPSLGLRPRGAMNKLKYPMVPAVMMKLPDPKDRPWDSRPLFTAIPHRPPPPGWSAARVASAVCTLGLGGIHIAIPSGAIDHETLVGSVKEMIPGKVSIVPTVGGPGHLVRSHDGTINAPDIWWRCGWEDMYRLMVATMNQDVDEISASRDAMTKKSVLVAYYIFIHARSIVVTHKLRRIMYPNLVAKIVITTILDSKVLIKQETLLEDFHDLSGLNKERRQVVEDNLRTQGLFIEDLVADKFYFIKLDDLYKVLVRKNACDSVLTPFEDHLLQNQRSTLIKALADNADVQAYLEHVFEDRLYFASQ